MNIIAILVVLVLFIIWIGIIVLDNYLYYRRVEELKKRVQATKERKKRNLKEFKWPDNLPHFDL